MKRIFTKGNVEVQNIKVGDIHFEFCHGSYVEVRVLTLPKRDEIGRWTWSSEHVDTGKLIEYMVSEGFGSQCGANLYDYEAYAGCTRV